MRAFTLGLVAAVLFLATPARGQETGGSFGGGDFSSGSSSSGSSDYSSGSSSGSPDYSSGGSTGATPARGSVAVFLAALFVAIVAFALITDWRRRRPTASRRMHASILMLGIDWHARRALQETLARLAKQGQTGTPEGRARLLREAVLALRRAQTSWLYVGYQNLGRQSPQQAEATFRRAAAEARARFRTEVIRNADGDLASTAVPPTEARSEEGPGTVMVSLIVVARRHVPGVINPRDAASVAAALSERGALTANDLVAFELVWSPAAEADRMSTAELEQLYPEASLIDPTTVAGRAACEYCKGLFPMELLKCPHCGAAVQDRA